MDDSPGLDTLAPHGFIPAVCSTDTAAKGRAAASAQRAHSVFTAPCRHLRLKGAAGCRVALTQPHPLGELDEVLGLA